MIRIITDSTSSLQKDLREKLGIHLLNLVVNRGGVSHVEWTSMRSMLISTRWPMIFPHQASLQR